jgi:AraC-like DNA-binding protein
MRASTLSEADKSLQHPSVQIVGTAQWRPRDRFSLWGDYVSKHSDAVAMSSTPLHDFRVAATLAERGDVLVNQAVIDPMCFVRTPRHAANVRSDLVRISYCRRVDGGIESGGKAAPVSDGAVYFRDYRGPGHFWSHAVVDETWLFVPRDWLVQSGKIAEGFDCAVFQSDQFLARLLAQRIEAVAANANDDRSFAEAVHALRRTIEDAFAARTSISHRRLLLQKADRLRRIKTYLAQHAGDSDLSPDRIADALGLKRSTLYRLLNEEGLQVSAHIAEYRLNAIAKALRDPTWTGCSIGEIAALWGHFDQAYLARAFKRHCGETPSQYRAGGVIHPGRAHR